jgi:predicted transposase YdaD
MRYDTTLKELLRTPPVKLIELLTGAPPAELLTVEYPSVKMRKTDLVFRQPDDEIHHFELQSENDDTMDYRMLEYYPLICRQFGRPPQQTLLYVGAEPLKMKGWIDHPNLKYRYRAIDIREFDAEPLLESDSPADNLLALLCHNGATRDSIQRILSNILRLPERERIDRFTQLLIISGLRKAEALVQEEVKRMPLTINPMENTVIREWIINAQLEGEEKGEKKGEMKGEKKGRSGMLRLQLTHRFGNLPKWAIAQLESADAETLEKWGLRLLDADKLEDVVPRKTAKRRKTANGHSRLQTAKRRAK